MLNINNANDIEKMKKYHRTKDMINLLLYFPEVSPVRNLTIVESFDDYYHNYEFCKNLPGERNDTLITKPSMVSVEGSGINPDIPSIFKRVKELDPDGVLVLFDLINEPSERYERYAGISIGVSVGNGVYIDSVSKGFDGREVSKGISCHERYSIPWSDLRKCNIDNFHEYQIYQINNEDYQESRNERINFLTSLNFSKEKMEDKIPKQYEPIPDFIWNDIIKNIIKKLEGMEDEFIAFGLKEIAISGHTEGKKFLPWQMFTKERYTLNCRKE